MSGRIGSQTLRRLAALYRVQGGYIGNDGRHHHPSAESLTAVLRVMGCTVNTQAQALAALGARRRERWERIIEPVVVSWFDENAAPETGWLRLTLGVEQANRSIAIELVLEDGSRLTVDARHTRVQGVTKRLGDGSEFQRLLVPLSDVPWGYHRVYVRAGKKSAEALLIRAPSRSYRATEDERSRLGLFAPLYALHSRTSWGIGDLSDLETMCELTARAGGSFFSTLPLLAHADRSDIPAGIPSPYSPGTRGRWNELYVDPRRSPEWTSSADVRRRLLTPSLERRIAQTTARTRTPYSDAAAIRREVLAVLAEECEQRRPDTLRKFRESDPGIVDYARFRAYQDSASSDWPAWPARARSGELSDDEVPPDRVREHVYSQMLAEEQLGSVARSARDRGVDLYFDFPLGVHASGYDTWRERDSFVLGADLGAPPDDFFTGGQNWTLPPVHPERARFSGHSYFRESLAHSMRHASMLRIDHVMGFHRQFWIVKGMENKDGVYVRYPAEELYAIANLESHRNRCELVGENLGTVPGHVNETLHRRGWRGMYVLQFSLTGRREEPASSPPRGSVLSVNTHDTPTFAGFCGGRDIDYRVAAGFLASSEAERERQKRAEALSAFDEYLGLGGDGDGTGPALRRRLHAWLSYLLRCAEGRVMVALEDLWLEEEPQNRPGTVGPKNWSRRLRYNMETLRENPDLVPDFTLPR